MGAENKTVLNFDVDKDLGLGVERLASLLGFSVGCQGVTVTAEMSDKNGVCCKNGRAVIYYTQKHLFFRYIGVLVENLKVSDCFDITEDSHFDCISAMISASRNAVPTVSTVKRLIDYLAVMGYGMVMLYTEDTIHLENREYFGYMRGRYETSELKEMDDYAYGYGIEMIPCIECYGHMDNYLIWKEASDIKDNESVLLAREDKTFEFLDELIGTVSSCFRSKRIHIGMDEAWNMGRGAFLDIHGYVQPWEIFNEYMSRLVGITDKYGLVPMMWSDMYFRVCSDNDGYYDEKTEITPEVANSIPEGVELVFWHYGEQPYCDDYMLKKHKALGRKVIYAGGMWDWVGHFPEHNYMMETVDYSLNACRSNGVTEAMATVWANDNAETDFFANLFGLSYFAEKCFDQNADKEKLRSRFEVCTGGSYDAFYLMSMYHDDFDAKKDYKKYNQRFIGKPLFWQDILEGLYDYYLIENKMSGHYAACSQRMKEYTGGKWEELYRFAESVFDYLAVKTLIAENLYTAYQHNDRDTLGEIARVLLPMLKEKTVKVHDLHRQLWLSSRNMIGWCLLDGRYAMVASRCDTAIILLERYLEGKDEKITALEEKRLPKPLSGFSRYNSMASPNLKTM